MNINYSVSDILQVKSTILQIYKNVRMLIRYNPTMRATLNLETKDEGIYVTDVAIGMIDKMTKWCELNGYTVKNIFIIVNELNKLEMILKDVLQYFHYFIRPDFRQKPDIEIATEKYKEIADKHTIEELRDLVGKSNKVDFEGLGSTRVELTDEIAYDEDVDGPVQKDDEAIEEEDEPLEEEQESDK